MAAKLPLAEVCRILGVGQEVFDELRGDAESLGGLLLELFNRLPGPGDETAAKDFTFHVLSADDKRIQEVRVTRTVPVA